MPASVRRVLDLAGARIASATSTTCARVFGASTTVLPPVVNVLTANGTTEIRRLAQNQPLPLFRGSRPHCIPKEIPFMLTTVESKNEAVAKLGALIERGRSRAANVIDHVMRHQPTDRLVRGDALQFRAAENLPEILITLPDREQEKVDQTLHRNAIYQMAQTTDMPVKFLDSLQAVAESWGRELLAHNLQTVFNRRFAQEALPSAFATAGGSRISLRFLSSH